MTFTVAIIGRPNVGKSTLFNRLTGTKHALVHDLPGVTRDRREGEGNIADLSFKVIDTAGLEEEKKEALETRMLQQTEKAVDEAHINLFVIDGRTGVTPVDKYYAKWLRKKDVPVIVLVNKCEGSAGDTGFSEALTLGFKTTIAISAEHNEGMGDLYEALSGYDQEEVSISISKEYQGDKPLNRDNDKNIQIAILGRPNTGKSTLMNQLLKTERVLTGPEAGITRDSIAIEWEFEGQPIRLIDTAGIRKRAKVTDKLEKLSVTDGLRALQYAHVGILMIDGTQPFEKQDLMVAEEIIKEGRAIVIAVNKWDLVKNKKEHKEEIEYLVSKLLPKIEGAPLVMISALKGQKLDDIIQAALKTYKVWSKRITTTKLNEWLRDATAMHTPPLGKNNRRIKLKYVTQGKKRPPTFMVFSNLPADLPDSYKRYLVHSLRQRFKLPGVPIRLLLRKTGNPYGK